MTVDRLLVGIGAIPDVSLAEAAGLTVDKQSGGVRTDARLRTSADDVYAAGDVANADHPVLGHPLRVEHWDTAIQHGKVVAANLLGRETEHDALPYFFTDQYDLGMEYVGNPGPEGFDDVVVRGRTGASDEHSDGGQFTAWWLRGGTVVAGMQVNDWDATDHIRRVVGTDVDRARLADESVALEDL